LRLGLSLKGHGEQTSDPHGAGLPGEEQRKRTVAGDETAASPMSRSRSMASIGSLTGHRRPDTIFRARQKVATRKGEPALTSPRGIAPPPTDSRRPGIKIGREPHNRSETWSDRRRGPDLGLRRIGGGFWCLVC
jgi:hypothetical protein